MIASPLRFRALNSPIAVNNRSLEEIKAVSTESWITPIINPIPTTCIAISFEIPNKLQAKGINSNEPPATPEAPQAAMAANRLRINFEAKDASIPNVCTVVNVITVIVTAAPPY